MLDLSHVTAENRAIVLGTEVLEELEPDLEDCSACPIGACACASCTPHIAERVNSFARKRGGNLW